MDVKGILKLFSKTLNLNDTSAEGPEESYSAPARPEAASSSSNCVHANSSSYVTDPVNFSEYLPFETLLGQYDSAKSDHDGSPMTATQNWTQRNNYLRAIFADPTSYVAANLPAPTLDAAKTRKSRYIRLYEVPDKAYVTAETKNVSAWRNLNCELNPENYCDRFHDLLWLEEAQQEIDMRRYDMFDEVLDSPQGNKLIIKVSGLAEKRPSLIPGDRLLLENTDLQVRYEGYIIDCLSEEIVVLLSNKIKGSSLNGIKFNIYFRSSRTAYRKQHHGVDQFQTKVRPAAECLFPSLRPESTFLPPKVDTPECSQPAKLKCFTSDLNIYQKEAVLNVLRAKNRPAPYVLYGPCGTGKTKTLVEAIFQVYGRSSLKVLVVANSNACCDHLAERIMDAQVITDDCHVIRLMAKYRMTEKHQIPESIKGICFCYDELDDRLDEARIVVTTCISSGSLYSFESKFDYVFVDEAGHANEPEVALAMGLLEFNGSCVLAGDPKQLGPVCISHVAAEHGLKLSMLERLLSLEPYKRKPSDSESGNDDGLGKYDPRFVTKLLVCYRSDERVLGVNNRLFYDDELRFVTETPQKWLDLLRVDGPLVFQESVGYDKKERYNPSWFNYTEALTCLYYVRQLYDADLKPGQLGIIAPYRAQIEKIKWLFHESQLEPCKIATMEEFQGDERDIIIISMVRTREKRLKTDRKFNLGFLFEGKRFNVGISRARWMVIVIGNRNLLKTDPYWTEFIKTASIKRNIIYK